MSYAYDFKNPYSEDAETEWKTVSYEYIVFEGKDDLFVRMKDSNSIIPNSIIVTLDTENKTIELPKNYVI